MWRSRLSVRQHVKRLQSKHHMQLLSSTSSTSSTSSSSSFSSSSSSVSPPPAPSPWSSPYVPPAESSAELIYEQKKKRHIEHAQRLRKLWKSGQVNEAVLYFDDIHDRHHIHWNQMIDGFCQQGMYADMLKYFEELKIASSMHKVWVKTAAMNSILKACSRLRDERQLIAHFRDMLDNALLDGEVIAQKKINIKPNEHSFTIIIHFFASEGKTIMMDKYLSIMRRKQYADIEMSTEIKNVIMLAFANVGNVIKMTKVMQQIKAPTPYTYSILMKGFTLGGSMKKALRVFERLESPNLENYITIMTGVRKGTHPDKLQTLLNMFNDLQHKHYLEADVRIYNILLRACGDCNDPYKAIDLWQAMQSLQIQPTDNSFNTMLETLARSLSLAEFHRWFEDLKSQGLEPSDRTANTVLRCFQVNGRPDRMEEYLKEMADSDMPPSVRSYNIVLGCFATSSQLEKIAYYLREMEEKGIDLDVTTHNIVLESYVHVGQHENMFNYYYQLFAGDFKVRGDIVSIKLMTKALHEQQYTLRMVEALLIPNRTVRLQNIMLHKTIFQRVMQSTFNIPKEVGATNKLISILCVSAVLQSAPERGFLTLCPEVRVVQMLCKIYKEILLSDAMKQWPMATKTVLQIDRFLQEMNLVIKEDYLRDEKLKRIFFKDLMTTAYIAMQKLREVNPTESMISKNIEKLLSTTYDP